MCQIFESVSSKGNNIDVRCVLVLEGVEIDLTGEANFDVLSAHEYKSVDTREDVEYLSYLIANNLRKAQLNMTGIDVEGYIFVTFRIDGQNAHTLVIMPSIGKISQLPDELDKLEILSAILMNVGCIDKRYRKSIENNVHLRMIESGKIK